MPNPGEDISQLYSFHFQTKESDWIRFREYYPESSSSRLRLTRMESLLYRARILGNRKLETLWIPSEKVFLYPQLSALESNLQTLYSFFGADSGNSVAGERGDTAEAAELCSFAVGEELPDVASDSVTGTAPAPSEGILKDLARSDGRLLRSSTLLELQIPYPESLRRTLNHSALIAELSELVLFYEAKESVFFRSVRIYDDTIELRFKING